MRNEPSDLVFNAVPSNRSSAKITYDKDYNIDVLALFNTYYNYSKIVDIRNNKVSNISYKIEHLDIENQTINKNDKDFYFQYDTRFTSSYKEAIPSKIIVVNKDKNSGFSYNKVTKELKLQCYATEGNEILSSKKEEIKKGSDVLLEDFITLDIDTKSTYGIFLPKVGLIPVGEY